MISIVSGILLIVKKLVLISLAGIIFTLACGVFSGPIGAYLAFVAFSGGGYWQVFGYRFGSPLIALSAISLILSVLGYRQAHKLRT